MPASLFDMGVHEEDVVDLSANMPFGHTMLKHFRFERGFVPINCGAYGAVPVAVANCQQYWMGKDMENGDRFFRYEVQSHTKRSLTHLGEQVGVRSCALQGLVFVQNASAAINAVLRSYPFKTGEKILFLSSAFGMTKEVIEYMKDRHGIESVEVAVDLTGNDQLIVQRVEDALKADPSIRMATFSHIVSMPGRIMPVVDLCTLCREYNVLSLVDGAQVIGQLELDLPSIGADFYVSNLHKWAYVPHTCAFLYVAKAHRSLIHPIIISFGYKMGLQEEFFYEGTRDHSTRLCVTAAFEFRRRIGGEAKIRDYNHKLAVEAGKRVAKIWSTEVLLQDTQFAAMVDVRLPVADPKLITEVVDKLLLGHRTYLAWHKHDGVYYARLSAQVYNELSDFADVAQAFLDMTRLLKGKEEGKSRCCHVELNLGAVEERL